MSDKLQYWINQNGVQAGPVTRDELMKMSIDSSAYVWSAGMDDWKPITEVEDLAGTFSQAPEVEHVSQPEVPEIEAPENEAPAPSTLQDTPAIPPIQPPVAPPAGPVVMPAVPAQPAPAVTEEKPKCPPTNLVWAIIATLLCCLPLGVVAIIYSTRVTPAYNQGDYEKAERMSETSAWWCIGAIVGGIIFQPISMLIQAAMMG